MCFDVGLVQLLSYKGQEVRTVKQSYVRYLGLLHYIGMSRAAFDRLGPLPGAITFSSVTNIPSDCNNCAGRASMSMMTEIAPYGWMKCHSVSYSSCWSRGPKATPTWKRGWRSWLGSGMDRDKSGTVQFSWKWHHSLVGGEN